MRLSQRAATFLQVARRARGNQIGPIVLAASVAGHDMIDRQPTCLGAAVLAAVAISAKDLSLAEPDSGARASNHVAEANDRRSWIGLANCVDETASVEHHLGLALVQKPKSAPRSAHIERFEVRIQNKNGLIHGLTGPNCGALYHLEFKQQLSAQNARRERKG